MESVKQAYAESVPDHSVPLNVDTIFGAIGGCPITSCTLHDAGTCDSPGLSGTSGITLVSLDRTGVYKFQGQFSQDTLIQYVSSALMETR